MGDPWLRVAVVADFAEERWPSMDLVADALLDRLRTEHADSVAPVLIRPRFTWRFTRALTTDRGRRFWRVRHNADRLLNRYFDYPRHLRRAFDEFDVFHIVDHSYAHLVRHVRPTRAIVTCHDLDAFRLALEPSLAPRSGKLLARPLRMMAERAIGGLRDAAMVACVSAATREELLQHSLVEASRAVVIPNGVAPIFSAAADPRADSEAARLLGPCRADAIEILHVGSTIPRKRMDVLLRSFAAIRDAHPAARLLRVGGPFTTDQTRLAHSLRVDGAIVELPFIDPEVLAAIYRRATMVLIPSEREGFGLPMIEAMACGAPVIASDLPVLREVGGSAPQFVTIGDVPKWTAAALDLIRAERTLAAPDSIRSERTPPAPDLTRERRHDPPRWTARRAEGLAHAARFSWSETVRRYLQLYRQVANEDRGLEGTR